MHTRRRVLATTGTVLSALSLSATTGAADVGSSRATTDSTPTEAPTADAHLDPALNDGSFAFVDLHALRADGDAHRDRVGQSAGTREETLSAVESAVDAQVDEYGIDAGEVLAYAVGDDYLSLTGTFDAVAVRLRLLFGSYDRVGEHAGLDCYVDETADRALAFTDGELIVTVGELGTEAGIRHTVDIATGADAGTESRPGTENRPTGGERPNGEVVAAIHESLDGDALVVGHRLADGEGPAGSDAAAVERRFVDGDIHDRHAYAFDRPGRIPLPSVKNHVARGVGELTESSVVGDCAVVETVVDGDDVNGGRPPAVRA